MTWPLVLFAFTTAMIVFGLLALICGFATLLREEEEPDVWQVRRYIEILKQFDYHHPPLDILNPEEREVVRRCG